MKQVKIKKRKLDIVVLSDLHLGTRGCHATELLEYLRGIHPKILVLNGDIVDIWQFSKRYWPNSHMKVVKFIIGMAAKNTKTYYITGNHDEMLRKFVGLKMGNLQIVNKLELDIGGKRAWFFHGDVFDVIIQHSKWLARLGAIGYDSLIFLNIIINRISALFGRGKVSLSKTIKENVKTAVNYINDFEETAANLAIRKGFSYIVCGHIHHPAIRTISTPLGEIGYLNSGDWIENLTALEYKDNHWSLYQFRPDPSIAGKAPDPKEEPAMTDMNNKQVFRILLEEFYAER